MADLLPELVCEAFPFHFAVDDSLQVRSLGRSLGLLAPGIALGANLGDFLTWDTIGESVLDVASLRRHTETLTVFRLKQKSVLLRGQMFQKDGYSVFLGSPWLSDPKDLETLGLTFSDFSPSDPVIDIMQSAQAQKTAVSELKELADRLRQQRAELRDTNVRLAQREQEARKLALVASRTDNGVVLTDPQGNIEWINEGFTRITGYSLEEVIGKKPGTFLQGPDTDLAVVAEISGKLKRLEGFDAELINYSKDGRRYWLSIEARPIFDERGNVANFMAIEADITSRKDAEERIGRNSERLQVANDDLSTQKARLDALIQNLDGGVLVEDSARRIAVINRNFCGMFGIPLNVFESGQLVGQFCAPMAQQSAGLFCDEQEFIREIEQLIVDGEPVIGKVLECKDGRFVQRDFVPIRSDGAVHGLLWHYRDVTRERRNLRILEAVAELSAVLLRTRLEGDSWIELLRILGGAIGADQSTVFQCITTVPFVTQPIGCWAKNGMVNELRESGESAIFPDWAPALLSGDVVSQEGRVVIPEHESASARFTESLLAVPVEVEGAFWGFLRFTRSTGSFLIKRSAMALLRSAATEIGLRLALQQDEDAMKQARREATEAAQAADEANRAKSTFLAAMSHEIRTPLNAVVGMSSLLLESSLTDHQREYARTVVSASETLLDLISEILDYSKIESGHVELDLAPFELREVLLEPLEILSHSANAKGLELSYFVDPSLPSHFYGDRVRLKQILINLIANGVKFTERGEVALKVEIVSQSGSKWTLRFGVRDTGIGIPSTAQARIFQPFSQADASITRVHGGTGLGLAISRRLVELMGGEIRVRSTPGEGSEFEFVLILNEGPAEVAEPEVMELAADIRGKRLLVVDDMETNRHLLSEVSKHWEMRVVTASNPSEALALLADDPDFDAAILDFNMPEMDGVALARKIRSLPRMASLPLVLFGSVEQDANVLNEGLFQAALLKPLRLPVFRTTLHRVLAPKAVRPTKSESPALDKAALSGLSVLVAEDNQNNQLVLRLMLAKFGCKATIVENGQLAVDAVQSHHYDLALLDIQMPVMDGLTAARQICAMSDGRRKPFLAALTANAFSEDRDACMQAGFDVYLSKPITSQRIGEVLQRVLETMNSAC